VDNFDLRKYLAENRLTQSSPPYYLSESLLMEADNAGIDSTSLKKGIEDVSKMLNINTGDLTSIVNDINKAEKEDDKEEIKKLQQTVSKKLEENLNEIGVTVGIAIASLLPKVMEVSGRGLNAIKRETPGWMNKETQIKAKKAWGIIKSKKETLKKLKTSIGSFSDLSKQPPGPTTKPKGVKAYNRYKELAKKYHILKKEIHDLEEEYGDEYGTGLGNWLKRNGHKLHKWYVAPFNAILWTLGRLGLWKKMRDKKDREKAADIFYAVAMIATAGYGVLSHLSHLHGIGAVAEVATEVTDGTVSFTAATETALEVADLV